MDKPLWRKFVDSWLAFKHIQPLIYYPQLENVDLLGRCLLQVGEKFVLLPFRHVPVETAYDTSFQFIAEVQTHDSDTAIQVCSDGSSRHNKGALAVSFLAPYAPIEQAIISQASIPGTCTSTRAEIRAAIQAFKNDPCCATFPLSHPYHLHDGFLLCSASSSATLSI